MKILSAVLVLVAAASSFGAVVTFNNPSVAPGTPSVGLTVTVTGSAPIGGVDVIMDSDTLDLSGAFTFGALGYNADNGNAGLGGKANERWVGGGFTSVASYVNPLFLGTLTIPTATLAPGVYSVVVDGSVDGISAAAYQNGTDVLTGLGTVTVTPEPMTMALLALGGLFIARRRHA